MAKKPNLEEVIYVSWEESERGWGTRPDGCSLHLTKEDFQAYRDAYWDKMPDRAPEVYSRTAGEPVPAFVTKKLYHLIKKGENGLRLWEFEEGEATKNKQLIYGKRRSGWVPII